MNKHPFHIEYRITLPESVKSAIDNVFDNFNYFLDFNSFSFDSISLSIGDDNADFRISNLFVKNIETPFFDHTGWFIDRPLIEENGAKDYIGTCFYLINCLQEYTNADLDDLGRFKFSNTYQSKFSCTEEHLVLEYFQAIALVVFKQEIPLKPSHFLMSHDIDFLHNGWKRELKKALSTFNFVRAAGIGFEKIKGVDPQQNIDEILDIEKELAVPSIFFFLTEIGRTHVQGVCNSDYLFTSPYVQNSLKKIEQSPLHRLGLHKSIGENTLAEESSILKAIHHRFHYLAFSLPDAFEELSRSEIQYDHSLGFSEKIGFRNSYGLPFQPYNPRTNKYYDFWEFPITIMDSSLHYYMGKTSDQDKLYYIQHFIEKNPRSCLISVLWHNDFFEATSYTELLNHLQKNLSPFQIK